MKVERKAEHAVSDETCKAATGRTLAEWHGLIDDRGGLDDRMLASFCSESRARCAGRAEARRLDFVATDRHR